MKCPSCEAEWQAGKSASVLATCPFCGASLAAKKMPADDEEETIEGVLRSIVLEYGGEVYKKGNSSKLKSLLSDFAVKFPKERNLLGVAISTGVQENVLAVDGGTEDEKRTAAIRSRMRLSEDFGMADDRATEAVNWLLAGLGWELKLELPTATPAQTVAPQSTGQAAQPSPIAASGTETVVAADGTGDYTTVQDAIDATAAGGTIRIKPGVYKGSVTLQKPLRIAGVDGSIRARASKDLPVLLLGADGHLTVTEQAAGAKISGVVFAQFAERFANLADYSAMRDDFDENSTGERARAVQAWNALPEEKRTDNYLAHIAGGVEFTDAALLCPTEDLCEISAGTPLFTDCYFGRGYRLNDANGYAERFTAFDVTNDASPVMNRCAFGGAKLGIYGTAGGTYRDCDIAASGDNGILIKNDAKPAIEHCDIHDNAVGGIEMNDRAAPSVRDCEIYGQLLSGIWIRGSAGGTYEDCDIHDNGWMGMAILCSAEPVITKCKIHDNSGDGVRVTDSAAPAVRGCKVYRNAEKGFRIADTAAGTYERCVIHDNKTEGKHYPGIVVSDSAKPVVRGCEIYGHLLSGISIMDKAGGTYENCNIHDNTGKNVTNESSGKPVIRNCE